MPGLAATISYAWRSWRGFPVIPADRALPMAVRFLSGATRAGEGLCAAGYDIRRGWLPPDAALTARVMRRLLPRHDTRALSANAINTLLATAPGLRHPVPWGDLLHLLLDLEALDAAGGRWQAAIQSLAIELLNAQDTAGTWTAKANHAVACTAAVRAAWALERLAQRRGGEVKLERAVTMTADWALSKQKTNGFFYSGTWSTDPATNPLTAELIDTAEGLLALGLARDHKHWRAAGLLTTRHLLQRVPTGHLIAGAWTSEWNPERHRSPLATLRLAELCDLAETAPSPERMGHDFAAAATRLRGSLASPPMVSLASVPESLGGLPSTLPAWGRPYPFAVSTEATASWLVFANSPHFP